MATEGAAAGLVSAATELIEAEPMPPAATQLSLLGDQTAQAPAAERSVGRPAGSRNRVTEQWRKHILGAHGSPLEFLAKLYADPIEQVMAQFQLPLGEALRVQIAAANSCLPYLHQRQPIAVESGNGRVPLVVVGMLDAEQQQELDDLGVIAVPYRDVSDDATSEGSDDD